MEKPIAFETINEKYTLRLTPKLDNETYFWGTDEQGNSIAIFPIGSTGTAMAENVDETGRIWWFVRMNNNKGNIGMFMHGDNNEEPYRCYGWMSSRYLKRIE